MKLLRALIGLASGFLAGAALAAGLSGSSTGRDWTEASAGEQAQWAARAADLMSRGGPTVRDKDLVACLNSMLTVVNADEAVAVQAFKANRLSDLAALCAAGMLAGRDRSVLPPVDIAGITEDVALYVAAGGMCGLPMHPRTDAIFGALERLDKAAFESGKIKAAMTFKGLLVTAGKTKSCSAARQSRAKAHAEYEALYKGLIAMLAVQAR